MFEQGRERRACNQGRDEAYGYNHRYLGKLLLIGCRGGGDDFDAGLGPLRLLPDFSGPRQRPLVDGALGVRVALEFAELDARRSGNDGPIPRLPDDVFDRGYTRLGYFEFAFEVADDVLDLLLHLCFQLRALGPCHENRWMLRTVAVSELGLFAQEFFVALDEAGYDRRGGYLDDRLVTILPGSQLVDVIQLCLLGAPISLGDVQVHAKAGELLLPQDAILPFSQPVDRPVLLNRPLRLDDFFAHVAGMVIQPLAASLDGSDHLLELSLRVEADDHVDYPGRHLGIGRREAHGNRVGLAVPEDI